MEAERNILPTSMLSMLVSNISNLVYDGELLNLPMATFLGIIVVVCINKLFGDLNPVGRSIELMKTFFLARSEAPRIAAAEPASWK